MYRALASTNIFSDADGSWRDADENTQRLEGSNDRSPDCDAFWNLNQLWNLVTLEAPAPEWGVASFLIDSPFKEGWIENKPES